MQNDCREITRLGCFFALARAALAARFEAGARCRLSTGANGVPATGLSRGMVFAAPPECVGVAPPNGKMETRDPGIGTLRAGEKFAQRTGFWPQ